ncbi:MAG: hybrid sensor histidine kinase/response regulator [Actinobacteria bacterium]|nr:hybrid sensor histidine kinase/response regulator [Actinomycetota bacterium]
MAWGTDAQQACGRVLVADDDAANVALLERVLKSGGYGDVHKTTDPGELPSRLSSVEPDLVLLDWHMPPASGADVLAALREDPRWSQLPVIVVTSDVDARLHALELGATDFLTKPFDHAEILLRVRNVLRIRLLHRQLETTNAALEHRVEERTAELTAVNEKLRKAEIVRRDFVAMASHEMRTPLTVIRGFVETWSSRGLPDPDSAGPQLDAVRCNARRMEHLIHNLLLASRVESGNDGYRRRVFTCDEILDAAVVGSASVEPVSVSCDVDGRFEGDPELLRVAVANLVSNADRYGEPPIEVGATAVPGGAAITVTDHGPGIPEDFEPRIFERFTQASAGDRRTAQGTGLGLWVARHIAELHGGRLSYERAPHGGASFTLRLPLPEFR